jgi:hypothetical protein
MVPVIRDPQADAFAQILFHSEVPLLDVRILVISCIEGLIESLAPRLGKIRGVGIRECVARFPAYDRVRKIRYIAGVYAPGIIDHTAH